MIAALIILTMILRPDIFINMGGRGFGRW